MAYIVHLQSPALHLNVMMLGTVMPAKPLYVLSHWYVSV